jgi:hypothetical protein
MTSPIVIEGDYHTMECVMYFRASLGVEPLITWTGPDPFLQAYSVTNVSVWSGISFTVQRNMDALSYASLTNFTQKGFNSPNSATNIPTWSYTWRSPQILVHCTYQFMRREKFAWLQLHVTRTPIPFSIGFLIALKQQLVMIF